MDIKRCKEIISFFDANPKAIIIFLCCIHKSYYSQQIADLWFTEHSPIFSKLNIISKMLDANLIVLDKKVSKTYYYKVPASIIAEVFIAYDLKHRLISGYSLQGTYELSDLSTFFKKEYILSYFTIDSLQSTFSDSKTIETKGIDYINLVTSILAYTQILKGGKRSYYTLKDIRLELELCKPYFCILLSTKTYHPELFFYRLIDYLKTDGILR